jgi:purine-nucleoside phosphorylase
MRNQSGQSAALIKSRIGDAPIDVGIVLGLGLSAIADQVADPQIFPYRDLPGFHLPAAEGPDAQLAIGTIGTARVAILRGRVHYYASGDIDAMWVPLQTLSLLGAKAVVLIGAAGSVKPEIGPGALVAISDHINLTGLNPLVGDEGDKRFVDLSGAYDRHLRERFALAAGELGRKTGEGVYMWFPGPSFETPAEIRAAQILGADIVGMSMVPEVIISRRLGLRVLGISMITNFSAGLRTERLAREQTLRAAAASIVPLTRVLTRFLELWTIEGPKQR